MKFFNKVQQVRAHAGSHKGAAIFAGRFCQSGVLAIEAPSKYPIIVRSFGSTGSGSWNSSKLEGNHDRKEHRRTGFKSFFSYFRQNLRIAMGQLYAGNCQTEGGQKPYRIVKQKAGKSPIGKRWAEEAGESFRHSGYGLISAYLTLTCRQKTLLHWQLKPLNSWVWNQSLSFHASHTGTLCHSPGRPRKCR